MGKQPPPGPADAPYICGKGVNAPGCEYPTCDIPIEPKPQHDCKYQTNTQPPDPSP